MAQPLLDFLTGSARAALPFIRNLVASQTSSTRIVEQLTAAGYQFRRQAMFDVISAVRGNANVQQFMRIVPQTTPLPPEAHQIAVSNLNANFHYTVSALDPVTDEESYITVTSEVPLSQAVILASAQVQFTKASDYSLSPEEYANRTVSIVEAVQSPEIP